CAAASNSASRWSSVCVVMPILYAVRGAFAWRHDGVLGREPIIVAGPAYRCTPAAALRSETHTEMTGWAMDSTMMDRPLSISGILWRAERLYADKPVVTQREHGEPARSTYGEVAARSRRLASALAKAGIGQGVRVATFGWN